MIIATLILILSTALCCFYFQVTCREILRRQFDREYFHSIATANRLEFLSVRESMEGLKGSAAYSLLRQALKCDFVALTYLLKNAANVNRRYATEERFLILYFRWQFLVLAVRRLLGMSDAPVILRLTSVLQYFANVLGQRVEAVKFGDMAAAELPLSF
jgi:hypothetical protein